MPGPLDHATPAGNQADRYALLKNGFESVADFIDQTVPPGREKALALTNLEQAAMWANKGVSRGDADFNTETVAPGSQ